LAKCSKAGLTVWVVETGLCALMPQLIFLLGVLKDDPFSRSQIINLSSSTSQRRLPKRMIAPFSSRDSYRPERWNSAAGVNWGCCSVCSIITSLFRIELGSICFPSDGFYYGLWWDVFTHI